MHMLRAGVRAAKAHWARTLGNLWPRPRLEVSPRGARVGSPGYVGGGGCKGMLCPVCGARQSGEKGGAALRTRARLNHGGPLPGPFLPVGRMVVWSLGPIVFEAHNAYKHYTVGPSSRPEAVEYGRPRRDAAGGGGILAERTH